MPVEPFKYSVGQFVQEVTTGYVRRIESITDSHKNRPRYDLEGGSRGLNENEIDEVTIRIDRPYALTSGVDLPARVYSTPQITVTDTENELIEIDEVAVSQILRGLKRAN